MRHPFSRRWPLGASIAAARRHAKRRLSLGAALVLFLGGMHSTTLAAAPGAVINVNDVTVTEGDSGTTSAVFTVSLSGTVPGGTSVEFATQNGTATGGGDFSITSGELAFGNPGGGTLTRTVAVNVLGDGSSEGNESFIVQVRHPTIGGDMTGVGSIIDDDSASFLSINDAPRALEGDTATFTLSLSSPSRAPVTVEFTTVNGSATAPDDYATEARTLVFAPGQTEINVGVVTLTDEANESVEEDFTVLVTRATGAAIADGSGRGVILDRTASNSLSIDDVQVFEGETATFNVSLVPEAHETVTVEFATANGTAVAPDDYVSKAGVLVFSPGDKRKTINVPVRDDDLGEPSAEFFSVQLSAPSGTQILDSFGQGTIIDNDVQPSLSINDVDLYEGDGDFTPAPFAVELYPPSDETVTVSFASGNDTAVAPEDYRNTAGLLVFHPGETRKIITVPVVADLIDEAPKAQRVFIGNTVVVVDETTAEERFFVDIFNPSNARVSDARGEGIIRDDDLITSVGVNDVTVTEGDRDWAVVDFNVSLYPPSAEEVTVEFTTTPETATAGEDFVPVAGTLVFAPGEATKTVRVEVVGDTLDEPDETFRITLSGVQHATVFDGAGVGTITDDDLGAALSMSDATVTEGGEALFTVLLSAPMSRAVTFKVMTENGTAVTPDDYLPLNDIVSIPPGEISLQVKVRTVGDTLEEPDEVFTVRLLTGDFAVADAEGAGVIVDDDSPAAPRVALVPTTTNKGYWIAAEDGDVFAFGDAKFLGSAGPLGGGGRPLNKPVVGMAATPTGRGYWLVASDGGIFAFGNARYLGSAGDIKLNHPIVGMVPTPSGLGYWLVASDGGIFAFGDAPFLGSTGDITLNRPIVGMAATPSGLGYWLVASDGGIFNFGDARFFGSLGGRPLNRPIVGMSPTTATFFGQGYRLVASDGGVFAFGDAQFFGSTGGIRLLRPITAMAVTTYGQGYWLLAADGGVFAFGDAKFWGSTGGVRPPPTS